MCGIFGYIGDEDPLLKCIAGLEQLEYRGYDSTGIAGIMDGEIAVCKKAGKFSELKKWLNLSGLKLAIGHTRWATHGGVTENNAHPHLDQKGEVALVHNGIIENYESLKTQLLHEGRTFASETDSEVIVQLIAREYLGDLTDAVQKAIQFLKGIFAIAVIHKDHPGLIVAAARECPLSIGYNDQRSEAILSSDPNAFLGSVNVLFMRNNEVAKIQKGKVEIFDSQGRAIDKKTERLEGSFTPPSKEGFPHFMLKEIYEQSATIQKAMLGRFDNGNVLFESLGPFTNAELKKKRQVWFIGSGTSAHAGMIGSILLGDLASTLASAEISSEVRYRMDLIGKEFLIAAISQSGETADTIAAFREARAHKAKVLCICNVQNSTLAREADGTIMLKAGPEMSVCSTKAFTSQMVVLTLFALHMARLKGKMSADDATLFYHDLQQIPSQVQKVLESAPAIEKVAKKYCQFNDFFFMGRRYMYPTCLEAALKLKEISYVNANAYFGGELKHGPIALLHSKFPVVAFCANQETEGKISSNLMEVKARGAPVLAFAPKGMKISMADDVIWLPPVRDELAPFASSVAGQLLAYYIAKERGCDIDQPRNLAKSVTVE